MDNVRIAVLSAYDRVRAFLDNEAPDALHYYSDRLHSYQEGSANTYNFTASAKHEDSQYLAEGNKLSFQYNNKDYYFNIVKVIRNEDVVEVTAYSLVFELLNEEVEAYKSPRAMRFEEYLEVFDFENTIELGNSEVADKMISHEWTGTATILNRIFSLANVFDAEVEFVPVLNSDYSLKKLVLNVYKEHDEEHQGIGRKRTDITLRYGKNVKGITKTSSITSLYTAIRPYGKDNLTIAGLDKKELDANGNVEYESPKGNINIYAVQARDRFPSNLMANEKERYIAKIWSYETDNVNVLYGQALAELKKLCVPEVKYEVKGYFDTDIGDTLIIEDEEFDPELYLEARVTEQIRSFTNPKLNETTFDNFRELKSEVDTSLLEKMNDLIKANKVYTCSITTDNGIVFKNGEGTTSLTANVRDAGADMTGLLTIKWEKDNVDLAVGKTVIVNADDIQETAVYRFEALDNNETVRGSCEVTVSNVSDGKNGVGVLNIDVQYYKSSSAAFLSGGAWQTNAPAWENGKYIWTKTVISYTDGKTGETSAVCLTGSEGGEGADGRGIQSIAEQYYKSASATALSGGAWSGTYPGWENGKFIWTRTMITYTDGTAKTTDAVCVTGGKGETGNTGPAGKGIKSIAKYYLASTAASGVTVSTAGWTTAVQTTTTSKKYLWNYEVVTYTDNTTFVSTPVIIGTHGETGTPGGPGPKGPAGADGQMLYATSGTAAATAAKVATLASGTITLKVGVTVAVCFTYANTAVSPTLNVNGTGAKAVYTQGVRYAYWAAGATVIFTYDGSYWRVSSEPVYASTATIGNPAGKNIYIDADGMSVRNILDVLASFKQNEINLGKWKSGTQAGDSASIKLYGTSGKIELVVGTTRDRMTISGGELILKGYNSDMVFTNLIDVHADDMILHTGAKDISLAKTGKMERIAFTSATSYQQFSFNLARYKSLVLSVSVSNGTRILASTVIPYEIAESYKGSSYSHDAIYGGEPANYEAKCYFISATVGFIKSKSTWDAAVLYGIF